MNGLLDQQIDALALLEHANYDLCSSQTPVTSLLFVEGIQVQLNAIRPQTTLAIRLQNTVKIGLKVP